MRALMCYTSDADTFKSGCDALYNMVFDCSKSDKVGFGDRSLAMMLSVADRLQELLVHCGAQLTCLIGMETHSRKPAVQEWACRALRGLSTGSCEFKEMLRASTQMHRIFKDPEFQNHAGVMEEAIGVTACLVNLGQILGVHFFFGLTVNGWQALGFRVLVYSQAFWKQWRGFLRTKICKKWPSRH